MQIDFEGDVPLTDYNPEGEGTTSPFNKLLAQNPKSVDVAAAQLILDGISVVANKPESKQPVMKGWQKRGLKLDEVPHVFQDGGNLGLLNIDVPEGLKIAEKVVTATLAGGRSGTRRAHRWRCAPGVALHGLPDAHRALGTSKRSPLPLGP